MNIKQSDTIYAIRLMNLLLKPFDLQKAFSYGIIDSEGKQLKKPETDMEKESYTPLHQLAFRLKKVIEKLPGSKFKVKQIAVALNLLKAKQIPAQYQESLNEFVDFENRYLKELHLVLDNDLILVEEESQIEMLIDRLDEEGEGAPPTNVTAGIEPTTPRIRPKKKKDEEIRE